MTWLKLKLFTLHNYWNKTASWSFPMTKQLIKLKLFALFTQCNIVRLSIGKQTVHSGVMFSYFVFNRKQPSTVPPSCVTVMENLDLRCSFLNYRENAAVNVVLQCDDFAVKTVFQKVQLNLSIKPAIYIFFLPTLGQQKTSWEDNNWYFQLWH